MKTVLAPGVFDCFHIGHLRHLQAARALGDRLVVSLTPDRFVNKGPGRPLFNEDERFVMLQNVRCVDEIWIPNKIDGSDIIHIKQPDIYACGAEWKGQIPETLIPLFAQYGTDIQFLNTRTEYSTTKIITGELLRERIDAFCESL